MPEPARRDVLDAERVHAVDAEQHLRTAALAGLPHHAGDRVHRELDPGARVHPGERHGAGPGADRPQQAGGDLLRRRRRRVLRVVERDAADAAAAQAQRLVRGEVVVHGREDLLALAQPQRAVEDREAHRRRGRQGDVVAVPAEVARGRGGRVGPALGRAQVALGVGVEQRAVMLDRRAHRARVGGEQEGGERARARVERQFAADARPRRQVLRGRGRRTGRGRGRSVAVRAAAARADRRPRRRGGPAGEQLLARQPHTPTIPPRR